MMALSYHRWLDMAVMLFFLLFILLSLVLACSNLTVVDEEQRDEKESKDATEASP